MSFPKLTWSLFVILSTVACTGGRVTKAGAAVSGSEVRVWTCEAINEHQTTTNSDGVYTFNPYSPTSEAMTQSKYIAPGPIAIVVSGAQGSSITRRNHAYDEVCDITYDNELQELPCKRQDVNLVPMTFPQFNAAALAFLEGDCGLREESTVASQAMNRLTPAPQHYSCLTSCRLSCGGPGISYNDFQICMCSCVEASCNGVSWGPGCVKATPAPND